MSRFLFVVPPLAGHVNPAAGVAAALADRGHEVSWAGEPGILRSLLGAEATVFPCALPAAGALDRPADLRGFAALEFLWERVLIPLAAAMVPGVTAAVSRFRPDVLVVDQQAVAGALVANRSGLPWATLATTSAELVDPLAGLPKVDAWVRSRMAELQRRFGDPAHGADLRFSPWLVLACTTEAFARPGRIVGAGRIHFLGPSLNARRPDVEFPWHELNPGRALVLITLGTVNAPAGTRFLTECVSAVRAGSGAWQAVIVDPSGSVAGAPPDVIVRPLVPQLALLARASAVICHAGHNTVCEALHSGVPLVVAPIRDDQPVVAEQVVRAGAGVRLRFTRATADHIAAALDTVLTDPAYRAGAERMRSSFRASGGAASAAQHLEGLLPETSARPRRPARGTPYLPALTVEQRDDIIATILRRRPGGGSADLLWTREHTADLIHDRLGARPSLLVVSNLLRSWGFTAPEPLPNMAERDPGALQRWRATGFRHVVAAARREEAPLFWITSRARHRPSVALRMADGVAHTEPESGMSVLSAISDERLLFFAAHEGLTEAPMLCDFLDRLCRQVGQRLHAVVDTIPLTSPDTLDAWFTENRHRVQAMMLPRPGAVQIE